MIRTFPRARLGALAAAVLLAGCADFKGIEPQASMRSNESVGLAAGTAPAFALNTEWWRDFGDDNLDRLIAQALAGNPNLKIAQARLAKAQAATEVARTALLPQVGGQFDSQRQKFSANNIYPPPIGGSTVTLNTLQLNGSWEIDFFGKNQAALNAALSGAQAAQADAEAARILLATNVARAYFTLARLNDDIVVAQRTLAQREESFKLVNDRVRAGLDSQLELKQSEGAMPEARQQIEALSEQAEIARHAIAALVGVGNQPVAITPSVGNVKAIALPSQIPADLLGQRADIAAARLRVEAAGYDVKNAKAQFYPNVNLVAFAGLSSIGFSKLISAGSEQFGIGPAIRLPIFEGGRLRANLRGKNADLDAAIESYNAAVLDAIRDTADSIASAQSVGRQQSEQKQAQAAAESAYDLALQRYKAGLGTYLNVLTAESAVLNQRRLAVDLSARALDTQVALIRALGGGATNPAR
ncbi:MAG TPA: efflux transporter outer membrane subunit [Ramlibacter sp.]|nr:efflux transporter outer membrane subunit [Ramlibacter sp.]